MNNIIIPLLISTFAGLSTMIGALLIYLKIPKRIYPKFITLCLSFSASIMISISIFDLIPLSFFNISSYYGIIKSLLILIISFILSISIIRLLNYKINNLNNLYNLGILNMIVLILHNLPEGIATFLSSYHNINLGIKLGIAIMLHNIPEGISIAIPIYYATGSFKKAIKATLLSSIAEPIGAILSFIFLKRYISELLISIILIVVAGLMITLSIEKIIPTAYKHKQNKYIYIGLILGLFIVFINVFFFS